MITGEIKNKLDRLWDAQFAVTNPYILSKMVESLSDETLGFNDKDMMVELASPTLKDTIIDPAMGSAGFLAESAKFIKEHYAKELMNKDNNKHFHDTMFTGFDTDTDMLRIGCMNMTLHGSGGTKKTELLFLSLFNLKEMTFTTNEREKFKLNIGDLLICEGGESGRCAIWKGAPQEILFQKAIHRARPQKTNENVIMDKSIGILDKDYTLWVKELVKRYRGSQIKAAIKVNRELLRYYWELGKDIEEKQADNKYGTKFYATLSRDLRHEMPDVEGLSETSIRYAKRFYALYNQQIVNLPQVVEESEKANLPQLVERLYADLFSIPWGHHRYIIDKCSNDSEKALFYVRQTLQNGWSRDMLLNVLSTRLYERSGKALTNFKSTLPDADSDLAQELTRDPYDFSFTGLRGKYNERKLKDTLLTNITNFLLELGTGFAYVGKEYRLQIAEKEKFIDLLFYNLKLSCYVVVEVKIGEFDFADAGQLGGYVVACNHLLRKEGRDNPTIGLLICKQKNNTLAQYALESSNQPLGISEYELEKLYPEKVEGTMPSIKEIEAQLDEQTI